MIPRTREEWRRYFFAHAPAIPCTYRPKSWFVIAGFRHERLPDGIENYGIEEEDILDIEMRWRHEYADRCLAELKILQ